MSPIRPLPRRALVAEGGRQLWSDQEGLSRGIVDVLWSWTNGTPRPLGKHLTESGHLYF